MRRISRSILTILASVFIALQLGAMSATAQTGNGLRISPTRQELVVERGEATSFDITVENISDEPVIARSSVNDFESDGVSGDPRIIVDPNVVTDNSIRDLLVDLEDIPLDGNESRTFRVNVQVPDATAPGAYFGLVRYQAVPVDDEGQEIDAQFSLNASLGVLVLIEVPGDVPQGAEVSNLEAQVVSLDDQGNPEGEASGGSIFFNTPNQVAVEVRNTGQTFVRPFGDVTVKNMLGGETASYELNATSPRGNILPDSTRVFTDSVGIGGVGRYTIEANVAYVQGGEVITRSASFWVLPIWFILVIVAVLFILAGGSKAAYSKFLG